MRTAAKRDTPEKECIKEAKRLGAEVFQVSGAGLLDTLVAHNGNLWWVEVKRPGEPLKPRQVETLERLHKASVDAYVIETPSDMRALLALLLEPWRPGSRPVEGVKKRKHRPGYSRMRTVEEGCREPGCATSRLEARTCCAEHA